MSTTRRVLHRLRKIKLRTFALLAATCATPLLAGADDGVGNSAAPRSDLWCKHTVLLYAMPGGQTSLADQTPTTANAWTTEKLKWLIACRNRDGKPTDFFFDGFLILGFSCKGGRHLLQIADRKPALKSDWEDALEGYLALVAKLSEANEKIAHELGARDRQAKVILAIPYPDMRQTNFGPVNGTTLDFSRQQDRLAGIKWYVAEAIKRWTQVGEQGRLRHVRLVGFYWGKEGIWENNPQRGCNDPKLVTEVSSCVHAEGFLMHWIPGLRAGRKDWKEMGLDCVTQQINYQNPQKPGRPLTIFDEMSTAVDEHGLHGVEMTPMARASGLNPRVWSWQQVHLANLEAALRLGWKRYPAMTYFHGGDILGMATDPGSRHFYDALCKWVKGQFAANDLEELSRTVARTLIAEGKLDESRVKSLAGTRTVLEQLQLMEKPEALR